MKPLFSAILILITLLALLDSSAPIALQVPAVAQAADWGQMPLTFVPNQGQADERVAFTVQGSDKTLYFASDGVTFTLGDGRRPTSDQRLPDYLTNDDATIQRWIVKLDFLDANPVRPVGQEQTETVVSYFKGAPEQWRAGLPTYSRIVYSNLWEGIDLAYSGTVNRLKYEFVVAPGADPSRIRLAYRGATVRLDEDGRLEVSTPVGGFHDDAPIAYQEVDGQRVPVAVAYVLADDATYGFRLGDYDPARPLVIDPAVLVYCGFIGGISYDWGTDIATDSAGYAYVTGYAASIQDSFPALVGPDLTHNGKYDAFVVKVRADGTGLVYAGYIGGSGDDMGSGITVDGSGNAYVTGITNSTEGSFPATVGPDLTYNGDRDGNYVGDAFVAKVRADGTGLVYAGYIGGDRPDNAADIAVDLAGNAYVTGHTWSTQATSPTLVGPDLIYDGYSEWSNGFVTKVKADGTGFVYSGYIDGYKGEMCNGIAVDAAGNAYVVGTTNSEDFPVLGGPGSTLNGKNDAFVARVLADGTGLAYAGYIGGSETDEGWDIVIDAAGNAYITGYTTSNQDSFPVLVGPDLTYNGGQDAFVAKVKTDGSGLLYCGYIGGGSDDLGYGVAINPGGSVYVAGDTLSTEATFPVVLGPDLTHNGLNDAFVAMVRADGTALAYAGYIGGPKHDYGMGIAVDSTGSAYIAGTTASWAPFPVTVGPDLTHNGGLDAFVAKTSPPPDNEPPTLPNDPITGSPLITPGPDEIILTPRPRFDWTDGTDNIMVVAYKLIFSPSSPLLAELPNYEIDTTVSEYTHTWNLPNGRYSWTVRAYDAAGNASEWAGPQFFTVDAVSYPIYLPLIARGQ